jgi:hypothetical protein
MASEQDQDGWNSAPNTFSSEDYSMKTWGEEADPNHLEQMTEEEDPEDLEKLAQEYLKERERRRGAEDPSTILRGSPPCLCLMSRR